MFHCLFCPGTVVSPSFSQGRLTFCSRHLRHAGPSLLLNTVRSLVCLTTLRSPLLGSPFNKLNDMVSFRLLELVGLTKIANTKRIRLRYYKHFIQIEPGETRTGAPRPPRQQLWETCCYVAISTLSMVFYMLVKDRKHERRDPANSTVKETVPSRIDGMMGRIWMSWMAWRA